jgi:autotransporter-associated beta strand protein
LPLTGHAQSYTSTSATGLWNTARWNNSSDAAPYASAWGANNNASFSSGTYNFSGANSSGAVNVGNITLASGVTVNFTAASGTIATSATRTIDVGSGSLLDFNTQAMSTAAGTGFIKNGAGVLATVGGGYSGGFTLNAGTVIARGVDAMGANASNVLTLNGGVVASNASRSFANTKFGGGIVIGGNVQFGELSTVVSLASSTANLSFANNVSLGSSTRTFTQGNNGTHLFSGVVSNTSGGITFAANASTDGRFDLTNAANTFTGDINVNGGEVRFTTDGSLGNAANDIIIDGGRFSKASDATTVTLGAGRTIAVGDGVGTGISSPGSGVLIYNGVIANKSGETGSWAKQGGGTLELGGVSTYTGNTAFNNGIVRLTTGNDRLPTGTVVSMGQAASTNLGTLNLNGFNQTIAGLESTSGSNAGVNTNVVTSVSAATLTINNSANRVYSAGTAANSGIISGAISLVKQGSGTQTLGGANTYTGGTTITEGTLRLGHPVFCGYPNSDQGNVPMRQVIDEFRALHPELHVFHTLPRREFTVLYRNCTAIVGNSSSIVIESGFVGVPGVLVGDRQKYRETGPNVLAVAPDADAIAVACRTCRDDEAFREVARTGGSPYGDGHAGPRVAKLLAEVPLTRDMLLKTMPW